MDSKYWFLVKFQRDWADEFDCHGFAIFSQKEWQHYHKTMMYGGHILSWNFGTNEGWEDVPSEELLENLTVVPLDLEQAKFFYEHFGQYWGHFPELAYFGLDRKEDYPSDIKKLMEPKS